MSFYVDSMKKSNYNNLGTTKLFKYIYDAINTYLHLMTQQKLKLEIPKIVACSASWTWFFFRSILKLVTKFVLTCQNHDRETRHMIQTILTVESTNY